MKRLMAFAVKLYPAAWRARYAVEFKALLDEVEPGWRASIDVLKSGIAMRLRMLNTMKASILMLLLAAAGSLLGLATATRMTREYESTSVVVAPPGWGVSQEQIARTVQLKAQDALSREEMIKLISRYGLYPSEMASNPIANVIEKMKEAIEITPVIDVSNRAPRVLAFRIQFTYPKPVFAQAVVQDLTRNFDGQLLEPATLPTKSISPRRSTLVGIGMVGGLLMGLFALLLRRFGTA